MNHQGKKIFMVFYLPEHLRMLVFPKFSLMDQFKGVDILNPQIMLGHAVWSFRITVAARGGEFLNG